MRRRKVVSENYLEKVPTRSDNVSWEADESGTVTLAVENKGVFNKMAQLLLKKPKTSYIHLDELGSFVWQIMDGERTIIQLGENVKVKFGEDANPLYERLVQYFRILENYKFIYWK